MYMIFHKLLERDIWYHKTEAHGEVVNQHVHFPFLVPKLNPRQLYIFLSKPSYIIGFLFSSFRVCWVISIGSIIQ